MASLRPLHGQYLTNNRYGLHEEVRYHGKVYIKKKMEFYEDRRFSDVAKINITVRPSKAGSRGKIGIRLTSWICWTSKREITSCRRQGEIGRG
jgi:hypothetical protein